MIVRIVCRCRMFTTLLAVLPIVAVAMPTDAEIEAANPIVRELGRGGMGDVFNEESGWKVVVL